MEIKTKKAYFKNWEAFYNCTCYFWRYGIYCPHIAVFWDKNGKKGLKNQNTGEVFTTLKDINRFLRFAEIEVEM